MKIIGVDGCPDEPVRSAKTLAGHSYFKSGLVVWLQRKKEMSALSRLVAVQRAVIGARLQGHLYL
jgi:hypothetical protein